MEYQQIGTIAGTHGLGGEVTLRHNLGSKNKWKQVAHVFIEINRSSYIPYFIEKFRILNPEEVLLQLDEIITVEDAKTLSGKKVYMEQARFTELFPQNLSLDMVGFTVVDTVMGTLGIIDGLFETPGQVLATLQYQGKEVMIPLVEATIKNINAAQKSITVQLPEGLLAVYL
jgi:16S rRNA processing protein RimM